MAAPSANGKHQCFNATVTNVGINYVATPVDTTQMMMASFEVQSDGSTGLTIDVQKSLIGDRRDGFATPRDDTYASVDWVTLQSYTLASGSAITGAYDIAYVVGRAVRIRITVTSGTSGAVKAYYFTQGWGS